MDRLIRDVRFALRQMARAPGFTAAAIFVLAVGIGTSTAIFGVVDSILLRPLDLPDSGRLVTLCEDHEEVGCHTVSPPNAADWAERSRTLDAIGIARPESFRLYRDGGSDGVSVGLVTPGLFRALGVGAARGRLIQEDDMLPAGDGRVVVLGHPFWRDELGGDPDVVGTALDLDGESFTVIGVLPEGVEVPRLEGVRLWTPLHFDPRSEEVRHWRGFLGFGRLAGGAAVADAEAELNRIEDDLAEVHPDLLEGWDVQVRTAKDAIVGNTRPLLLLFLGAVGVVLLIVSVNLAGFLLARAAGRTREMAVRSALGADRTDLVRQLVVEAAVLGVFGGVAGIIAALWATEAFVALAPPGVPRIEEVAIDARVLGFGLIITFVSALIFGLVPALRVRALNLNDTLKHARGATGDRRSSRLRQALVVTELALALALVLSSGLLLRSFSTLVAWDPGFDYRRILTVQLFPPQSRYPDGPAVVNFYREARDRFAAIPGVEAVGTASAGPLFGGFDGNTPFIVEGRPEVPVHEAPRARWYDAGPGYFPALGIPIVEGSNLTEAGRESPAATLINEAMARRYWPEGDSPIGDRIRLPDWGVSPIIVGIVPDIRPFRPDQEPEPAVYVSNRQFYRWASHFVLRVDGDPSTVAAAVRQVVSGLDPDVDAVRLATLEENLADRLVGPRFNVLLVGLFALVALVLGATGVYGVIAYAVALRTREIGIRMALGADRRSVLRATLRDGLVLVGLGLVGGAVVALAFTRLLHGVIVGVQPTDPVALAGTVLVLGATGVAASLLPALRAARTDPVEAIRTE